MKNSKEKALAVFRAKIDSIDDQIIDLLKKRMDIISEVGEFKKSSQEHFFIRSAREADMIKALVTKSGNVLPKSAIVSIWRKIITAANMCEQEIAIAVHNPHNIADYNYIVREYYSDTVPVSNFDSATSIVSEIEKGKAQIGIFALPNPNQEDQNHKEDAKENWWIGLANNRLGLKVFAKIPFVEIRDEEKKYDKAHLVAVAVKESEKSEDDKTLLYIEVGAQVSKAQIAQALKEQNLSAIILKSVKLPQVEGVLFYLIEIDGFYLENANELKELSRSKIKPYVKVLGHYATPVLV